MPPRGYSKKQHSHKCQYCSYVTHRRSFMNDHVRVHTGEKPFSCDICGKSFSQKSNLRQHQKVHNQGNNSFFSCKLCDFKTKWKSSLQVHDRMHKGEKPYKCKICDRAFSQSTHCQTHMREAHLNMRNFQCDICSKTFKRHEHLERHLAFHKEERNFECDICNKKYLDARYLKQHKLIHEGDASKIHQCPLCPYKSRYSQGLKIHTRIHTGLRPYVCESCSKAFVTSQSLKLHHRMVHQGLAGKIFHCDKCNFSTANNQNLKQHLIKIHVGQKDRRTVKCQHCSSLHNNRSSLNSHMAHVHAKQLQEHISLRHQNAARSPVKVIGSLSPAGTGRNGQVKVRMSPRAKVRVKAGSPGRSSQVTVKHEPVLDDVKRELFQKEEGFKVEASGNGKLLSKQRSRKTNGKISPRKREMSSDVKVLSSDDDAMVIDIEEGVKNCNKRIKPKSAKSPKRNGSSSAHEEKSPKKSNHILKIKLNLPKGKNSIKMDKCKNSRPKSPASSTESVTRSPGSDRGGKKLQKKVVTPSKERARALFISPDEQLSVDKYDSSQEPPPMPELLKQTEAIDYSQAHIQRTSPSNQDGVPSKSKQLPSNHTTETNEAQVVLVMKQYASLRDIATPFLNNNSPDGKSDEDYMDEHMIMRNSYSTDQNGVCAGVQIKEEPPHESYVSDVTQETALDMRCLKAE